MYTLSNTTPREVSTDYVHALYSLRWQIEILFKTWKSFFEIDACKTIKKEHLECHLYGQLIGILLCSSTMFHMRQLLLERKKQELSELKAIYMIKDYFRCFLRLCLVVHMNSSRFSIASINYSKRMDVNAIGIRR